MAVHVAADLPVHPLTVEQLETMLAAEVFDDDDRVELLNGVLVEMSPKTDWHADSVVFLTAWLAPLMVAGTHDVRIEQPIRRAEQRSRPEPDVAVVPRSARGGAPTTAELVIEVAWSSHRIDREIKAPIFAAAAVPDFWLLDLRARTLEVRRDPRGDVYRSLAVHGDAERIAPLGLDVAPLDLGELFAAIGA